MVVIGGLGVTETVGLGGADDALAEATGATGETGALSVAVADAVEIGTGSCLAPAEEDAAVSAAGSGAGLSVRLQATGSRTPRASTPTATLRREDAEEAPQKGQQGSETRVCRRQEGHGASAVMAW